MHLFLLYPVWRSVLIVILSSLVIVTHGCSHGKHDRRPERPITSLEPLADSEFWSFKKYLGDGKMIVHQDANGDFLELTSIGEDGMAATVNSIPLRVEPGREYIVKMEIKTENLVPITAKMVGGTYFYYRDLANRPAGWYPAVALFGPPAVIAPPNTDWTEVMQVIKTPTTAGSAQLFLAYAAYGTWEGGHPRVTGRAKGRLWIRNVTVKLGNNVDMLPSTIHVPDSTIQAGIETVSACIHNSSINGQFVVSDGYTISGNIVPDLSFGLFGVRRLGYPQYIEMMRSHWKLVAKTINDEGRVTSQRVMSQVLFPLGVDEIFSFSGDMDFLAKFLPQADRALKYVIDRSDENGLSRLVEYGQWHMGEGADWVDWYPTRMEGKTFNFHQWYVRALRRMAALHEEFACTIGDPKKAQQYRMLADKVEDSLRRLYWRNDHFIPNIDYGGKPAEETWCDDQVWSIRWGIATPEQTRKIWAWIDAEPSKFEGVPMRWAAFDGPQHGDLSWFGRVGAGDILARYHSGHYERGLELIKRISELFARDRNVYEAYDMEGNVAFGTGGWGNYTEHCGGYIWSVIEGPFGISFDSDSEAVAIIQPHFPKSWHSADAVIYVRGTRLVIKYSCSDEGVIINLDGQGSLQPIRFVFPDGKVRLLMVGTGSPQVMRY